MFLVGLFLVRNQRKNEGNVEEASVNNLTPMKDPPTDTLSTPKYLHCYNFRAICPELIDVEDNNPELNTRLQELLRSLRRSLESENEAVSPNKRQDNPLEAMTPHPNWTEEASECSDMGGNANSEAERQV